MSGTASLFGLGLRIIGAVVGWVFHRPRWLFPLRLAALGLALVVAANLATTGDPASRHATTSTRAHDQAHGATVAACPPTCPTRTDTREGR